jgi:hypothetical protein
MVLRIVGFIWLIVNGLIIIIPKIVPMCLVCEKGFGDPNYIGLPATIVIGAISIILGVAGLISAQRSAAE